METKDVKMKSVLAIFIFLFLAVFGFGQNANVLVGTNGEVVSPTNFWSANITNANSGLGLGSAATNSASAFQPSSSVLTNLANSNGSVLTNLNITNTIGVVSLIKGGTGATNVLDARNNLGLGTASTNPSSAFQSSSTVLSNLANSNGVNITNIQASSIVGSIASSNIPAFNFTNISGTLTIAQGGTSATNASSARQNLGSTTIGDALFTASNAATARSVIGGTDVGNGIFTLANPSAVTFLRLNADNTVSAIGASDFRASIGLGSSATNPSSAFQTASSMLTNLASSNALYLSNIQASNIVGILAISNGGTGADNITNARVNLGLGATWLTNTNVTNFRSSVELGTTDDVTFNNVYLQGGAVKLRGFAGKFLVDSVSLPIAEFSTTLTLLYSNVQIRGSLAVSNASVTRTNLGLGATWLTNTNVTNFRSDIGLGSAATNLASAFQPSSPALSNLAENNGASLTNITVSNLGTISIANGGTGATNVEAARTNLGLGSTNTVQFDSLSAKKWTIPIYSSGGVLVGSNTIAATSSVIEFTHFGTLGLSVAGDEAIFNGYITNGKGITVGTDAAGGVVSYGISFASNNTGGAAITRTNLGLGSSWLTNTNNPVFVNTNGVVVSPTNFWQVAPIQTLVQNISPVTNSTNAATNARNLYVYSLATNIVNVTNTITLPTNTSSFDGDEVTVIHRGGLNSVTEVSQLGSTNNLISLNSYDESVKFIKDGNWDFYHNISFTEAIRFSGTNAADNATTSRTNLGIPLSALTNTSATNFQKAIFYTNTAPSNIGGNLGSIAAWIEIVTSNGVTYKVPAYTNIP